MDNKEDIKRYIDEIANSLINNNAAAMIGSGFSKNAKKISYNPEQKFCEWNELADKFYMKLFGEPQSKNIKYYSPLALAEEVETIYGRPILESILKDSIPDMDYIPDVVHNNLLSLPWKDIFTTNYDTLLEKATENIITRTYNIVNCKEDLVNSSSIPRIIKLHGSFPSHRPFIITEEDYRKYPYEFAPFVNTVQQALIENTFCMIGFSCDDPNFLKWIGWMNDNLGKKYTQNIYMISLSGESEAKQKKLLDKNIRLVNLDILWPNKTYYEKINDFILYLKNKIYENKKELRWNITEVTQFFLESQSANFTNININDYIYKLRELRKSYPGWITLPKSERNKASYITTQLYEKLKQLKKYKMDNEIDFIYEYLLFKQIINMPILIEDGYIVIDILNRNVNNKEKEEILKNEKYQTIYLQLLRFYRENSMIDNWNEINDYIEIKNLNYEQLQFLNYERCMFQLFQFNSEELKKSVNSWNVDSRDFTWSLKKSYLLTELGELEKAKELSMKSLEIIRKRIIRDKKCQYRLLSCESCFISFINYVDQAIRYSKDDYEDNMIEEIKRENNNYNCDRENKYYELLLKSKYDFFDNNEVDLEFDLNRKINKYSFGKNDEDAINAFQYLRFREETGQPFRISNVVNNSAVIGVVKRIVRYNSTWPVLILVMSKDKKGLDYIFNRSFISQHTVKEINKFCFNYLNILKSSLNNLNPENWFNPSNIFEYAAQIIPEVLSRLCSKCSLEKLDEILDICLIIYKSSVRSNIKEMNKLISRLINAYTIEQLYTRINKICEFPIIEDDIGQEYPDPVLAINISEINNRVNLKQEDYEKCIKLLIRDIESCNKNNKKVNRLVWLYFMVQFKDEDKDYIKKLIWNDKEYEDIPTIDNFYSSVLLEFPKDNTMNLKSIIKNKSIKEYCDKVSEKGMSSNTYIIDEILNLVYKNIIGLGELQKIVTLSINHYYKIIKYKKSDFGIYTDTVSTYLKKERDIIFYILLNELEHKDSINKECRKQIEEYINKLESADISVVKLKLACTVFFNNDVSLYNEIFNSILSYNSDDVIGSIMFLVYLKKDAQGILTKDEYKKIIDLITERILFESIYVNINIVYSYIELIKKIEFKLFLNSERIVLYLISYFEKHTVIEEKNHVNIVKRKCEMRQAIAELACVLHKKYLEHVKNNIPKEICRWREVCKSEEEFVEIRRIGYQFL